MSGTPMTLSNYLEIAHQHLLSVLVKENLLPEDAVPLALEALLKHAQPVCVRMVYDYANSRLPHQDYVASPPLSPAAAPRWGAELALEYYERSRSALPERVRVDQSVEFARHEQVNEDFLSGRYEEVIRKFNAARFGVHIVTEPADTAETVAYFTSEPETLLLF